MYLMHLLVWKVSGNKKLTNNNPIKLTWSNSQDITFEKYISLDDQFLFTIKEKIINRSDKSYNFYSYGQIIRNKITRNIWFLYFT